MDAEVLLNQLGQLGKQLEHSISELSNLDLIATGKGGAYQELREEYEDALAGAFMDAEGSVEARKGEARLACKHYRIRAHDANMQWEEAKSRLRTQQATVKAIHTRIEIGRSLLSHEKALMGLGG